MSTTTTPAGAPAPGTPPLARTSDQILGPFYPSHQEPDKSGDLTRVAGRAGQAQGQVLIVTGRVTDRQGNPVQDAKIEIWQANAAGKYRHPNDDNPAPLDPSFEGFAAIRTDADGRYRLRTVKPAAYPASPGRMRPAHIHFEVFGQRERLVTQLYFEGDPHQESDTWLRSSHRPETIVKPIQGPAPGMAADEKLVVFDIVLMHG